MSKPELVCINDVKTPLLPFFIHLLPGHVTRSLPQSAVNGFHSGSVLATAIEDDERSAAAAAAASGGEVAISMDQMYQMKDQTDTYLQSRADTMQSIEKTIVELGGIFSQVRRSNFLVLSEFLIFLF